MKIRVILAVMALAAVLPSAGCSMGTGMDSTGRIGEYKSIDEFLPTVKKGVTTKGTHPVRAALRGVRAG